MAIPAGMAAAALVSALLGWDAQRRQAQAIQEAQRQAEERYRQNYEQLSQILAGILDPNYSAISQDLINQVVDQAAQDIWRQQEQANEQILRQQARRGLAGHSLIDQRQAYLGERAQEALADARLRAQLEAQNLTAQQQAQARALLAGLTSENFGAMQQAARDLISSQGQLANTYAALAGRLVAPYLESWGWPQEQQASDSTYLPASGGWLRDNRVRILFQ